MKRRYRFGPFELEVEERILLRHGGRLPLTPKQFDTLLLLVRNAGNLVGKTTLLNAVWPGVHVEPNVLTRTVSDLRKALQQNENETWIETVPKFGYRFVGEVTQFEPSAPSIPVAERQSRAAAPFLVLAVAALAVLLIVINAQSAGQLRPPTQLAVLPFQVIGTQILEPEALSIGIADAIILRLSALQGIAVRPVSAIRPYANWRDSIEAGRELQADLVLEGTLQASGQQVRVSARLVRPRDGTALWAGTADSPLDRLFTVEDSLAQQVASNLALRLPAVEKAPPRAEAHESYLKGRYEWGKRTREGFEAAASFFQDAVAADPAYARAYAGLADSSLLLGGYGFRPQLETLPKARVLALRALELDPQLAEAEATLGLVTQNLTWDMAHAETHYRKAIALSPGYATAFHWYAELLSILGRFEESHLLFARARQMDPLSPIIQADQAQLYFFERRFDRSIALLRQLIQLDPDFELARERIAFAYLAQGREKEAWQEVQAMRSCPVNPDCRIGWTAWLPGVNPAAAKAALRWLEAESQKRNVEYATMVFANARHGKIDRALDWLERMTREHGFWLITAKVNPLFDSLRGQPRFRKTLASLNLD
jgi:serine/threonine-protein kinase